jgi:hypothetical protein
MAFIFASIFIAGGVPFILNAQVNEDELKKAQGPVTFINYEGPYARIDTFAQIRTIGYSQGTAVKAGSVQSGASGRYFVIHSLTPPEGDRLDADIFGLGVDVGVDHIKNLRLIVQSYLEGAYDYGSNDAALVAEYITIYNAVFRGNWDYISGRYKQPVLGHLTPDQTGLSIRYDEWPGRTLMLIPLGLGTAGSLSAIDTGALTDPDVMAEIRSQEDMGLEQREEMAALKAREAEEAARRAAELQAEILKEEQRIAQERQAAEQARQEAARQREQTRVDQAAGLITPAAAQKVEVDLIRREAEADKKDAELDERETALISRRMEMQKAYELAARKAAEALRERQDIAMDRQMLLAKAQARNVNQAGGVVALLTTGDAAQAQDNAAQSNAAQSNAAQDNAAQSGRPVSNSGVLNARALVQADGKLLAIAGENRGNAAVRLVELDDTTLQMVKQGNDDIYYQSPLWINGNSLFAIINSGGKLYLGRFNTNLVKEAQSGVVIRSNAVPTFQGEEITIHRVDGIRVILNATTLSEIKR